MSTNNNKIIKNQVILYLQSMPAFHKILFLLAMFLFIYYSYLYVVLFVIGMLPTIVCFYTNKNNADKLIVIAFFNLSGLIPYIFALMISDDTLTGFYNTASNMFAWICVYGFAGIGAIIYYSLPKLLGNVVRYWQEARLKQIEEQLENLKKEWGEL